MNKEEYESYLAQKDLQQDQIEAQSSMNAPQLLEDFQRNQAVLVEQTNPKKIVKEIILRLRGLEEKPDGSYVKVAESKVNAVGQDNIWFILDSHINQNVILSHLETKEIVNIMEGLQRDVVDDLSMNWKAYGIQKKTDLDTIQNSILINIFLALKRAEGQNEKNWLGKITLENVSGSTRLPPMKKDRWWSKWNL